MGVRGPIPNRSGDQSRARDANRGERTPVTKGVMRESSPWPSSPDWDPSIQRMWESLANSGQADFYQDSDWGYAWFVFDEANVYRRRAPIMRKDPDTNKYEHAVDEETGELLYYPTHKPSGQMFQAIMSALTSLGMTEGDRRRMRIELEQEEEKSTAAVEAISQWENVLGVVPD